jgi:hypothetical protein
MDETNEDLLTNCNFSEAVWEKIGQDSDVHPALIPFQKGSIANWIEAAGSAGSKQQQRKNAGIILLFWWNIERNRQCFENQEASFLQVSELIKAAAKDYSRAFCAS